MRLALGGAHGSRLMACNEMIDRFTTRAFDREAIEIARFRQLAAAMPTTNVLHVCSVLPSTPQCVHCRCLGQTQVALRAVAAVGVLITGGGRTVSLPRAR